MNGFVCVSMYQVQICFQQTNRKKSSYMLQEFSIHFPLFIAMELCLRTENASLDSLYNCHFSHLPYAHLWWLWLKMQHYSITTVSALFLVSLHTSYEKSNWSVSVPKKCWLRAAVWVANDCLKSAGILSRFKKQKGMYGAQALPMEILQSKTVKNMLWSTDWAGHSDLELQGKPL